MVRELQNVNMDDYMEFVDDNRHAYLDDFGVRPAVEDIISSLFACPELSRREYTWSFFKLCSLCLGYVNPKLPNVPLGSSKVGAAAADLSCVIEPIQGYLLSCDSKGNIFTDFQSVSTCSELLETF